MESRAHIHVSGSVQGVFFRDHTRRWASSARLKGWVKNLRDGRVEILVEGDRSAIESLIQQVKTGPPLSRVKDVSVEWEEPSGEFHDFRVTF